MKARTLSFITMALILILSACAPSTQSPVNGGSSYRAVTVDHLEVGVGVGSPIPVHVVVSGTLPNACSQLDYTEIKQNGSHFMITLSAIPSSAAGCIQDALPFRMRIPLNVTNLPAGEYSVEVNGSSATFKMETGNTTSSLPRADSVITKSDVQVGNLNYEIGMGSPMPVHLIVHLSLPNTCAQIGEIRLHREDITFYVRLVADIAERADCRAARIPVRADIPLNLVDLTEGPYVVDVNGVTMSFDPRTKPALSDVALAERNLIPVENVEVQVGVGSPIPVEIVASGAWPDRCAQIAEVESKVDRFQIDVTVRASTVSSCPPDHVGPPFRFALPLKIVELPQRTYTVIVNGIRTTFDVPVQ